METSASHMGLNLDCKVDDRIFPDRTSQVTLVFWPLCEAPHCHAEGKRHLIPSRAYDSRWQHWQFVHDTTCDDTVICPWHWCDFSINFTLLRNFITDLTFFTTGGTINFLKHFVCLKNQLLLLKCDFIQ